MTPRKTRIRFSKTYIALTILFLLIAAAIIGWNMYKYKFIKGKVKSAVYEKTNGLYTIRYDKMDLDEVGGYLHVTNLEIIPDTARYLQMVKDKTNPGMLLQVSVPELTIAGVKTPEAMVGKKVSGRKLEIGSASIIIYYAHAHPDSSKGAVKQELYQQLLGSLKEIQADSVELSNISAVFIDIRTGRKSVEASNVSIHLRDVAIDSIHANDTGRFFFSKHVDISAEKGLVKSENGVYFYTCAGISFTNNGNDFSVRSLQVEPQMSEERFAAYSKVQNDRFNCSLRHVSLSGINLSSMMLGDVVADKLDIKDVSFKVFRDLSYPHDKKSRIGQFPQQLLVRMPLIVNIKKLAVENAFIEYKEKNPKSNYSGRVQFEHSSIAITNVTNDPYSIKMNNHCLVDFHSKFLGMVNTHAHLDLILNDPNGRFGFRGSVDSFSAANLNVIMRPMALAEIEKGRVNNMNFDFKGNNYGSHGKVTLLYEDLKLTLLKKDSANDELRKKKLASFVANIIVKNANPQRKQPVRVADVDYERDTVRSFFNLMWKSIYKGIKKSAGM